MTTVHICRGPAMERVVDKPDGEPRWCFKCRSRQPFRYTVDAPTEPSYYGPNPSIRCGHCGTDDGDCFPGTAREWDG